MASSHLSRLGDVCGSNDLEEGKRNAR